ncbi:ABC transporter ATP-binding protein [Sulfitobacter sp. S190]|uniref:ABC transporter ATP-binding protein n=1 Tax=Sulfitobacter sp. S190 TaxID=2867022 RepID=UPI0021A8A118|nr:ABC transporter ATP-binding protein [Sulfitobacter sp. S190]UWR22836.1 ABC transporter ATP-binding protein [Sulfitobacter sp. S190]
MSLYSRFMKWRESDDNAAGMPPSLYRYVFRNSRKSQISVTVLTLILAALQPATLELQRRALDDAVADSNYDLLIWLGMLYLAALVAQALVKFAMRVLREMISTGMVRTLRGSVYNCVYTKRPPNAKATDEVDDGAVVSILANEVEKLGGFAGSAVSGPLLQVGTLVFVLGYMLYIDPLIATIAIVLYAPQFVIVPLFQRKLNDLSRTKAQRLRTLGQNVIERPDDEKYGKEPPQSYNRLSDEILKLRNRFVLTKHVMKAINNMLIALGPFGVIFYGGWQVIEGNTEVGVIVAFISGLERIGGPIRELVQSYREIADAHMRYDLLLDTFEKVEEGSMKQAAEA